jgi:hypothetical protein
MLNLIYFLDNKDYILGNGFEDLNDIKSFLSHEYKCLVFVRIYNIILIYDTINKKLIGKIKEMP